MADNQTATFMKNVIITHKELQFNLFEAFTSGLMSVNLGSKDLFLSVDINERDYIWQVSKQGNPEPIYWCYINKGEVHMNDIRLGVTINYLREKADEFLTGFNEFYYGTPQTGSVSTERNSVGSESKVLKEA